jgi:nucleoside triphosphate diphosphatase
MTPPPGPLERAWAQQLAAADLGFDWPDLAAVWAKFDEEWRELAEARQQDQQRVAEELGDLLFTLVNLARHLGVDPAASLTAANQRFADRFAQVTAELDRFPPVGHPSRLVAMEASWQRAKQRLSERR